MAKKDIWSILRGKYPPEQYALMAEVSDKAGFSRSRSADYIAMGLWQSRGLYLEGIELKSFRGDWLKELKNPKKAENIFKYCDLFWLLTSDESVAKIEEIPATWGWMNIKAEKIFIKKQAPMLTPSPIDRSFLSCLLRRAVDKADYIHIESIEQRVSESFNRGIEQGQRDNKFYKSSYEELKKAVDEFQEASGIEISRWGDNGKVGKVVYAIMNSGIEYTLNQVTNTEKTITKMLNAISSAVIELKESEGKKINLKFPNENIIENGK